MSGNAMEETAEIHYGNGTILRVPKYICDQIAVRAQLPERYYVDIKEGAQIYCMCENTFRKLAKAAGAGVNATGKRLYSVKAINRYLDYFREDGR